MLPGSRTPSPACHLAGVSTDEVEPFSEPNFSSSAGWSGSKLSGVTLKYYRRSHLQALPRENRPGRWNTTHSPIIIPPSFRILLPRIRFTFLESGNVRVAVTADRKGFTCSPSKTSGLRPKGLTCQQLWRHRLSAKSRNPRASTQQMEVRCNLIMGCR